MVYSKSKAVTIKEGDQEITLVDNESIHIAKDALKLWREAFELVYMTSTTGPEYDSPPDDDSDKWTSEVPEVSGWYACESRELELREEILFVDDDGDVVLAGADDAYTPSKFKRHYPDAIFCPVSFPSPPTDK